MEKTAEDLKKHDEVLAQFIANRTGKPLDEVVSKMEAETWFTGSEAKEFGIASELLSTPNIQNSISAEVI
ncbi:ATP-dependent Clp protease proteolytic subunit, partial [Bacillus cereus]